MDYRTKGMSRIQIRKLAKVYRNMCGYDDSSPFDPVRELDRMHRHMKKVTYEIVSDDELPQNVPAACEIAEDDSIVIKIKEKVYIGANERKTGGYLMDITHEMMHAFLYQIGLKPTLFRSYQNNFINPYESMEWQAKALAGEVMIPYEASKGMNTDEIMKTYHVSKAAAEMRIKLEKSKQVKNLKFL